jgi:tetratricopeptide (TPR) repeat protein
VPWYLQWVSALLVCGVWLLLVIAPVGLIYRNLPQLRAINGPLLKHYTSLTTEGLPAQGAVVLGDEPGLLLLLQSALTQSGRDKDYVLVDTGSLPWADYHRFLARTHPGRWQSDPPKEQRQISDADLVGIVWKLCSSNSLYYLHPSFGYYFEVLYAEPHGLVYKLNPYPTNSVLAPLPDEELIRRNENFWARVDGAVLKPLVTAISTPPAEKNPPFSEILLRKAHLKKEIRREALAMAVFYSRALVFWGVELQKAGRLKQAAAHFERALDLNPDNSVALANLECNRNLQAGQKMSVQPSVLIEDRFGKFKNWEPVMNVNGPFDEPSICYRQGVIFALGGNYRQAAQQYARVKELSPDDLTARLRLAHLCLFCQMPAETLKVVDEIHAQGPALGLSRTNQADLLYLEACAHLARKDVAGAEATVKTTLAQFPQDEGLLATATRAYMEYGCYSNGLALIEQQLKTRPNDPGLLLNQGFACVQLKSFDEAIAPLSRVVAMGTNSTIQMQIHYTALSYRAYAYLQDDKLDEAQHDYEVMQKAFPTGPVAVKTYLGLAEVALGKKDTNAAIRSYHLCLANSSTNSPDASFVRGRLKELKPSLPR